MLLSLCGTLEIHRCVLSCMIGLELCSWQGSLFLLCKLKFPVLLPAFLWVPLHLMKWHHLRLRPGGHSWAVEKVWLSQEPLEMVGAGCRPWAECLAGWGPALPQQLQCSGSGSLHGCAVIWASGRASWGRWDHAQRSHPVTAAFVGTVSMPCKESASAFPLQQLCKQTVTYSWSCLQLISSGKEMMYKIIWAWNVYIIITLTTDYLFILKNASDVMLGESFQ